MNKPYLLTIINGISEDGGWIEKDESFQTKEEILEFLNDPATLLKSWTIEPSGDDTE